MDIDQSDVDFIEDPEDHKPGKAKGAKKPRKASAPAAAPAGARPSDDLTAAGIRESVQSRIVGLSFEVPTINPLTVWDLPLWAWQSYAATYDELIAERKREASP